MSKKTITTVIMTPIPISILSRSELCAYNIILCFCTHVAYSRRVVRDYSFSKHLCYYTLTIGANKTVHLYYIKLRREKE